jgi:hypothetical protein
VKGLKEAPNPCWLSRKEVIKGCVKEDLSGEVGESKSNLDFHRRKTRTWKVEVRRFK